MAGFKVMIEISGSVQNLTAPPDSPMPTEVKIGDLLDKIWKSCIFVMVAFKNKNNGGGKK